MLHDEQDKEAIGGLRDILVWQGGQDPPCCIENVIWCDEEGLTLLSMSVFFFSFWHDNEWLPSYWQVIAMSKSCFRGDKKGPLPPCHICLSISTWQWGMPLLAMLKITVATLRLLQTINVYFISYFSKLPAWWPMDPGDPWEKIFGFWHWSIWYNICST